MSISGTTNPSNGTFSPCQLRAALPEQSLSQEQKKLISKILSYVHSPYLSQAIPRELTQEDTKIAHYTYSTLDDKLFKGQTSIQQLSSDIDRAYNKLDNADPLSNLMRDEIKKIISTAERSQIMMQFKKDCKPDDKKTLQKYIEKYPDMAKSFDDSYKTLNSFSKAKTNVGFKPLTPEEIRNRSITNEAVEQVGRSYALSPDVEETIQEQQSVSTASIRNYSPVEEGEDTTDLADA